jgi:hypothetical protein
MAEKKSKTSVKRLSTTEFKELIQATKDPFFFSQFIKVIHPIRGKVPFLLYPFQKGVLWNFLVHRFNIILKFRQAGVTELISMYCLWLAMYHPNKNIIIISINERVSKKVLRKIKYMYRNLPDHIRVDVVNGKGSDLGTASELEFVNGSLITSVPTTEEAARSEAVSLLVVDEAAIVRWADKIWASSFPTLSTGGAAIVNSTPYGIGNWYHKTWVGAFSNGNGFNAIRLRWQMHPERDIAWYEQMSAAMGPRRTAQEIDGDFLTSGNSVFDLRDIRAIEEDLTDNIPTISMNGSLYIHKQPVPGERYWIGGDVATGRSRDYSTFTILNKYGEEYGCFKQKIPVGQFADLLMKVGKEYNNAYVAPETNDIGLAVTTKIQEAGYRNLYYSSQLLRKKGESRHKEIEVPGWLTTVKNRELIINGLEEDIRLGEIITKDPFFVSEAYTFIYDHTNRPVAMGKGGRASEDEEILSDEGFTDDAIMGKAITNHIRKGKVKGPIVLPR